MSKVVSEGKREENDRGFSFSSGKNYSLVKKVREVCVSISLPYRVWCPCYIRSLISNTSEKYILNLKLHFIMHIYLKKWVWNPARKRRTNSHNWTHHHPKPLPVNPVHAFAQDCTVHANPIIMFWFPRYFIFSFLIFEWKIMSEWS